jgi:hypothetical protein
MEIPFTSLVFVRKSPFPSLGRSGMAGKAEIILYARSIRRNKGPMWGTFEKETIPAGLDEGTI